MGRGRGRRGRGSRRDGLFLDYNFDLFTQDDNEVLRTPNGEGTFVGAIEDFELNVLGSTVDFDNNLYPVDNGENPLDESIGSLNPNSSGDRFSIPTIESLNLTASFDDNGTSENDSDDFLSYTISSTGSELSSFGIDSLTIRVDTDGITLPDGEALDTNAAITDIEYIIDNELLDLDLENLEPDDSIIIEARGTNSDGSPITEPITSDNIQASSFELIPEVIDPEVPEPTSTILIEAEDLHLDTYEVEDLQKFGLEGQVISLLNASGHTGTASLLASDFELSGEYDLELSYFDESDGEAQIEILQNGNVIESIILDDSTVGNVPREENRRTFTIEDLDIASTDNISIRGIADSSGGGEWARIDNISFLASTQSESETPVEESTSTILIEAEDLHLDTYEVEDLQRFGLEGEAISLLNASGHTGTASLLASDFELSGEYDLELSYFDESDGEAQIEILQNGNVIESIILDDSTVGNVPREENRRTFTIEDLDIAPTDNISIRGIADTSGGGEWARIDNISFLANAQPEEVLASEQSFV